MWSLVEFGSMYKSWIIFCRQSTGLAFLAASFYRDEKCVTKVWERTSNNESFIIKLMQEITVNYCSSNQRNKMLFLLILEHRNWTAPWLQMTIFHPLLVLFYVFLHLKTYSFPVDSFFSLNRFNPELIASLSSQLIAFKNCRKLVCVKNDENLIQFIDDLSLQPTKGIQMGYD